MSRWYQDIENKYGLEYLSWEIETDKLPRSQNLRYIYKLEIENFFKYPSDQYKNQVNMIYNWQLANSWSDCEEFLMWLWLSRIFNINVYHICIYNEPILFPEKRMLLMHIQ